MKDMERKTEPANLIAELEDLTAGAVDVDQTDRIVDLLNELRPRAEAAFEDELNDPGIGALVGEYLRLLERVRKKTELCKKIRVRVVQV